MRDDIAAELVADWPQTKPLPRGPEWEAYVGQVARLRDAQKRLETEGSIIADAKGNPVPHPALAIERAAADQLRKWGTKFNPRR